MIEHFKQFVGSKAHIRVQMPVEERRNFNGTIKGVDGSIVVVEDEEGQHCLDFNNIKRANLIGQI